MDTATQPVTHYQGTLHKGDETGDTATAWDTAVPETVTLAERAFDELRGLGYLPCGVYGPGELRQLVAFDATAPKIIMMPALVGG